MSTQKYEMHLTEPYNAFFESLRNEVSTSSASAIDTKENPEWCGRYLKDFLLNLSKTQTDEFKNRLNSLPKYCYSSFEQMAQKGIGKNSLSKVLEVSALVFGESAIKNRLEEFVQYCDKHGKDISALNGYSELQNIISARIAEQIAKQDSQDALSAQEQLIVDREISSVLKAIGAFPFCKERLTPASPDEARRLLGRLNELRKLYPNYLHLEITYCRILLASGNKDAALELSSNLYEKHPEHEVLLNTYLLILMRFKQYELCEEVLLKSKISINDSAILCFSVGCLKANNKNYDKAIELFLECIRLEPDYAMAYYSLVRAYNESEQLTEAENTVLRSIKKFGSAQLLSKELLEIYSKRKSRFYFFQALKNYDRVFFSDFIDSLTFIYRLLLSFDEDRLESVIKARKTRLLADPLTDRILTKVKLEQFLETLRSLSSIPGVLSKSKTLRQTLIEGYENYLEEMSELNLETDDKYILTDRKKRSVEAELLLIKAYENKDYTRISHYLIKQANIQKEFLQPFYFDKAQYQIITHFYKKSDKNAQGGLAYLQGLFEHAQFEYSLGCTEFDDFAGKEFDRLKHLKCAFTLFRKNVEESKKRDKFEAGYYISRIKMWECASIIGELRSKPKMILNAISEMKTYLDADDYNSDDKDNYWSFVRYFIARSYLYLYQIKPDAQLLDEGIGSIQKNLNYLKDTETVIFHGENVALYSEFLMLKHSVEKNSETLQKALDCVNNALEIFTYFEASQTEIDKCLERQEKIVTLLES